MLEVRSSSLYECINFSILQLSFGLLEKITIDQPGKIWPYRLGGSSIILVKKRLYYKIERPRPVRAYQLGIGTRGPDFPREHARLALG